MICKQSASVLLKFGCLMGFLVPLQLCAFPAKSGSWVADGRTLDGWVMQILPDDRAVAVWFTHGKAGGQSWMIGTGEIEDTQMTFDNLQTFSNFDGTEPVGDHWGTATWSFDKCSSAQGLIQEAKGQSTLDLSLERFTRIQGTPCRPIRSAEVTGEKALSGAWTIPGSPATGWFFEELGRNRVNAYWFGYTSSGAQAWITGTGVRSGDTIEIAELYAVEGGTFRNQSEARLVLAGSATIELTTCDSATIAVTQSGTVDIAIQSSAASRLTTLASVPCDDTSVEEFSAGTWTEVGEIPWPIRAYVPFDGRFLVFGKNENALALDPETLEFTAIPGLPFPPELLTILLVHNNDLFYIQTINRRVRIHRYLPDVENDDPAERWEPIAELPLTLGSIVASYGDEIYVALQNRFAFLVHPETGATRPSPFVINLKLRGHPLFYGDMSGAYWEYVHDTFVDPLFQMFSFSTLEMVERTPALYRLRGSAGITDAGMWVTGGKSRSGIVQSSTEIYLAKQDRWVFGPDLPEPAEFAGPRSVPGATMILLPPVGETGNSRVALYRY